MEKRKSYDDLLGMVCVRVDNVKCSECSCMDNNCNKLELVGGDMICLSRDEKAVETALGGAMEKMKAAVAVGDKNMDKLVRQNFQLKKKCKALTNTNKILVDEVKAVKDKLQGVQENVRKLLVERDEQYTKKLDAITGDMGDRIRHHESHICDLTGENEELKVQLKAKKRWWRIW